MFSKKVSDLLPSFVIGLSLLDLVIPAHFMGAIISWRPGNSSAFNGTVRNGLATVYEYVWLQPYRHAMPRLIYRSDIMTLYCIVSILVLVRVSVLMYVYAYICIEQRSSRVGRSARGG